MSNCILFPFFRSVLLRLQAQDGEREGLDGDDDGAGGLADTDGIFLGRDIELRAHGVLVGAALGGEDDGPALGGGGAAQLDSGRLTLARGIDELDNHLVGALVEGGVGVEALTLGQGDLVDELAVEEAAGRGALDLNLDIVPAAVLEVTLSSGEGVLAAVSHVLNGMLTVAPAAEVPPQHVLTVLGTEGDDEALVALEATTLDADGVVVRQDGGVEDDGALGTLVLLLQYAAPECPLALRATSRISLAAEGAPLAVVGSEIVLEDDLARLVDNLEVAELSLGAPGGEAHVVTDGGGERVARHLHGHYARTYIISHKLLDVVGRCAEALGGVEANHVGTPGGVVLVDEDGGVGTHDDDVGVALQALHINSLAEGGGEMAVDTEALRDGIFTDVDLGAVAVVAVVLVEVVLEPRGRAVVVLVEDVDGVLAAPRWFVGAPRLHVADDFDLGVLGLDSLIELDVALEVVVALVAVAVEVEVGILVAHFEEAQVEGLGVTVLSALGTPLGGLGVAVGIFDGVERLLDIFLDLVVGLQPSVADTHVDDEQGFSAEILGELQHLVVAEAVGDVVAPVDAEVSGPLFDGSHCVLPFEAVVEVVARRGLAFDIAAAGEAHELGVQRLEQFGEVDAAAVGAPFVGGREEAYDIEGEGAGLREGERHAALGVGTRGAYADALDLGPLACLELQRHGGLSEVAAVAAVERDNKIALVGGIRLHPRGEGVGGLLAESHAPVALVLHAAGGGGHGEAEGMCLAVVEEAGGGELSPGTAYRPPVYGLAVVVLEGAVLHEFGIESAVAGVVDFLEEDTVEARADGGAHVGCVDVDLDLCAAGSGDKNRGGT